MNPYLAEVCSPSNLAELEEFEAKQPRMLIQQSVSWGRAIASLNDDEVFYLILRDRALGNSIVASLTACLLKRASGNLLISVPLAGGYGGIVSGLEGSERREAFEQLLHFFLQFAREMNACLSTICTPPFGNDIELYKGALTPSFELSNFFQYLDLTQGLEASLNSKQRNNLKRNLKIAAAAGVETKVFNDASFLQDWYPIHQKRMEEIGATTIPFAFFDSLIRELFPTRNGFFVGAYRQGRMIGGSLFLGRSNVLDLFMMSTDSACFESQPGTALVYQGCSEALSRGYSILNWQSSSSKESGVFSFKKGFGAIEGVHFYLTKITGEASRLAHLPLDLVRKEYQFHFVMPYSNFKPAPASEGSNAV